MTANNATCRESAFKLTDQEVTNFYARSQANPIPGVPEFDYRRVVDGQRKLTIFKPLPTTSAGKKFELRSKVTGVYDKGKSGSVVDTEQSLVDKETGEVYAKTSISSFFVGQGNWGGPKGEYLFGSNSKDISKLYLSHQDLARSVFLPQKGRNLMPSM